MQCCYFLLPKTGFLLLLCDRKRHMYVMVLFHLMVVARVMVLVSIMSPMHRSLGHWAPEGHKGGVKRPVGPPSAWTQGKDRWAGVLPMRKHSSCVQVSRTRTSTKSFAWHQDLGFFQVRKIIRVVILPTTTNNIVIITTTTTWSTAMMVFPFTEAS